MNKKMIVGLVFIILGTAWGIIWRLQSATNANYDNFDPGYFFLLPGIIIYFIGLNKKSAATKGLRFLGNFLVFIGSFSLLGLGQSIGTVVYGKKNIDIMDFMFYSFIILLFPIGTSILLKKRK